MKIVPDNAQHIGAREEQQDAFGFSDVERSGQRNSGALAVVADGMGGMADGRAASLLACRVMIDSYATKRSAESIPEALDRAAHAAQDAVLARARQLGVDGNSGTTVAAAAVFDGGLHWISVGDTRVYLWRGGELTQLTVDHAYVRHLEQQVMVGELSQAEAGAHPDRRALTSFLGVGTLTEVDRTVKPFPLRSGDRVLICTDGIHGTLSEDEIAGVLDRHTIGAAQALVDAAIAKRHPSQDNATVALLDCPPLRAPSPPAHAGSGPWPRGQASPPPRRASRRVRVAAALAVLALAVGGIAWARRSDFIHRVATGVVQLFHGGQPAPAGPRAGNRTPPLTDSAAHGRRRPKPADKTAPPVDTAKREPRAVPHDSLERAPRATDSSPAVPGDSAELEPPATDSLPGVPADTGRPSPQTKESLEGVRSGGPSKPSPADTAVPPHDSGKTKPRSLPGAGGKRPPPQVQTAPLPPARR